MADPYDSPKDDPPGLLARLGVVPVTIAIVCTAVEALLTLSDLGVVGSPVWRSWALQHGAFWAGLLHGWRPNYDAQPVLMFLTYGFLHAGPSHLIGNVLALLTFAPMLADHVGQRGLALIYAAATLGGAAVFGLMSDSYSPMVGASGAIFGLAGALVVWDRRARLAQGQSDRSLWIVLGLVALNGLMWWWQSGLLAWETHLGGFVAGAVIAAFRIGPGPARA